MIDGIITGYEESFDFPQRSQPPALSYLLASVPRAGSTYASHLFWRSGCFGAPLEYLNFEPTGPYGAAAEQPQAQTDHWHRALARRTSPNGVFGIKSFPGQLHHLQQANPALVNEVMRFLLGPQGSRKVVQLRRRNRDAHAISYARAMLSGIWRQEQERDGRAEPAYSAVAVKRCLSMIDQQEQGWLSMYRDLGIQPLELWFEDMLERPEHALDQLAAYLGVEIVPAAAVNVPVIHKQAQEGAREWARQHADET